MTDSGQESTTKRVTELLRAAGAGDAHASEQLMPLVYTELRRLARTRMAKLPPGQTIQPTALVHEAYLRVVGTESPNWSGRHHFFGAAAQAMRNILVDQARRKALPKHGGRHQRDHRSPDDTPDVSINPPAEDILSLDRAMTRLEDEHPRRAQVVMLRYFAGLTQEQIAEVVGVSERTVEREWRFAKAWLRKEIHDAP